MAEKIKIRWIRLYRFQSHLDNTIYFDDLATVLTGPSDNGKSCVIRALYWVLYNRPTRDIDEYLTHGTKHTFVTIKLSTGVEITRGRKDDENYYVINPCVDEVPAMTYKGFGMSVPPDVTNAHRMPLITFDDSGEAVSLNVSQQLDSIFLLKDTPIRRAKMLGKISGADRADGALDVSKSWLNAERGRRKVAVARRTELRAKLGEYKYLDEVAAIVDAVEESVNDGKLAESSWTELTETIAAIAILNIESARMSAIMLATAGVTEVDLLLAGAEDAVVVLKQLIGLCDRRDGLQNDLRSILAISSCVDSFAEINALISILEATARTSSTITTAAEAYDNKCAELKSTAALCSKVVAGGLKEIDDAITKLVVDKQLLTNLRKSVGTLENHLDSLWQLEKHIANLRSDLELTTRMTARLLEGFSICPVCEAVIDGGDVHE